MAKFRVILVFFFTLYITICAYSQSKLIIDSPKDRSTTQNSTIVIKGQDVNAAKVLINGVKVPIFGAKFDAMAMLKPGKNLININLTYKNSEKASKYLKVLRIVSFDDLNQLFGLKEHWAKQHIITLSTIGIVEGYSDNTFKPEDPITRGEFATWLCRAKGLKMYKPAKDVFFDVPKEHWRAKYIKAVTDAGYMTAMSENVFGIDSPLKRADATVIMAKTLDLTTGPVTDKMPFSDINKDTKDVKYLLAAYKGGLIIGTSRWRKIFDPERDMKRAEAVALLARIPTVKTMRGALYDFSRGYSSAKLCRISTRPIIKRAVIEPKDVKNDGRNNVKINVVVYDEQGKGDISQVWADLSELGGPVNAKLNTTSSGASYEVSFAVSAEAATGIKKINIQALDKSGLKTGATIKINIIEK